MHTSTANVIPMQTQQIAAYDEFRTQLVELEQLNKSLVFNYEDEKGNKDARSHVRKLRSTKSAVDKARQKEKAASLDYGRRVDAEAKEIMGKIETMIDVHQKPLDEIEAREKERVAKIQSRIATIVNMQQCRGHDSKETAAAIKQLQAMEIDESFGEFQFEAMKQRDLAVKAQQEQHETALKQEEDARELAKLRAQQQEQIKQQTPAPAPVIVPPAPTTQAIATANASVVTDTINDAHEVILAAMQERGASIDVAESLLLAIRHGKIPHLQIVY